MATVGGSMNANISAVNKQRCFPPWESLSSDILVEFLAYSDASDLTSVRCSNGVFRRAARDVVARSLSLKGCSSLSPDLFRRSCLFFDVKFVAPRLDRMCFD